MNYIKHLTGFFEKVAIDKTLNPTHVSLYMSLFQFWNCNRFKNPISINRDEVMRISKISSKATYHKCLKNLHSLGYLNYEPSYNPFKGSHVYLFNFSDDLKPIPKSEKTTIPKNEPVFELVNEQVVNKSVTNSQTSTEQALVSYINNTNNSNNLKSIKGLNERQHTQNLNKEVVDAEESTAANKEKKLREKKKDLQEEVPPENPKPSPIKNHYILPGLNATENNRTSIPTIAEVQDYFKQERFPDLEAQKFYNYFASIGWLVGGRTAMQNWKAAAQNWMLNANKFTKESYPLPQNTNKLNATTEKNYAEPL